MVRVRVAFLTSRFGDKLASDSRSVDPGTNKSGRFLLHVLLVTRLAWALTTFSDDKALRMILRVGVRL